MSKSERCTSALQLQLPLRLSQLHTHHQLLLPHPIHLHPQLLQTHPQVIHLHPQLIPFFPHSLCLLVYLLLRLAPLATYPLTVVVTDALTLVVADTLILVVVYTLTLIVTDTLAVLFDDTLALDIVDTLIRVVVVVGTLALDIGNTLRVVVVGTLRAVVEGWLCVAGSNSRLSLVMGGVVLEGVDGLQGLVQLELETDILLIHLEQSAFKLFQESFSICSLHIVSNMLLLLVSSMVGCCCLLKLLELPPQLFALGQGLGELQVGRMWVGVVGLGGCEGDVLVVVFVDDEVIGLSISSSEGVGLMGCGFEQLLQLLYSDILFPQQHLIPILFCTCGIMRVFQPTGLAKIILGIDYRL